MKTATLRSALHPSLKRASRILGLVKLTKLTKRQREMVWVGAYANCREQGYAVNVLVGGKTWSISFAEARNSDSVVVYSGTDFNDGMPTEEAYEDRKFFSGSYRKAEKAAANWISARISSLQPYL